MGLVYYMYGKCDQIGVTSYILKCINFFLLESLSPYYNTIRIHGYPRWRLILTCNCTLDVVQGKAYILTESIRLYRLQHVVKHILFMFCLKLKHHNACNILFFFLQEICIEYSAQPVVH